MVTVTGWGVVPKYYHTHGKDWICHDLVGLLSSILGPFCSWHLSLSSRPSIIKGAQVFIFSGSSVYSIPQWETKYQHNNSWWLRVTLVQEKYMCYMNVRICVYAYIYRIIHFFWEINYHLKLPKDNSSSNMTKSIHIGELIKMKLAIEVMVSSLTYSSTYETRNDEILHADPAVRDQAHQNFGDTIDGLNACTKDVWNPISNRIFSISTAARLFFRNHQKHMQTIETLVSAPSYVFFFWVSAQLHVSCLEICMESGQNWSHCRCKRIRCFFF